MQRGAKLNRDRLIELLRAISEGNLNPEAAYEELKHLPYKDLGFARVDHHRAIRQGMPEVIFCAGKTSDHIASIAKELRSANSVVIATKASEEAAAEVLRMSDEARYFPSARIIAWGDFPQPEPNSYKVSVITAGTADLPIAEEAAVYLAATGVAVEKIQDVGIAGVHRLFDVLPTIQSCTVHIVVAGMDGALPALVAGLVPQPVIAVPTSVGYGASFGGLAALLTMLNSCSAGLTVVNIDNGFGAAVAALRLLSVLRTSARPA
jgi:NCAIR mutase (PurE)-related protein